MRIWFKLVLYHAVPSLSCVLSFRRFQCFQLFIKDQLFNFQDSSIVYKFQCDAVYIGQNNQRLEMRIAQHVPVYLRSSQDHSVRTRFVYQAAFVRQPGLCDGTFISLLYNILSVHHLRVLDAVHIKFYQPSLCRQKEYFIRSLCCLEKYE